MARTIGPTLSSRLANARNGAYGANYIEAAVRHVSDMLLDDYFCGETADERDACFEVLKSLEINAGTFSVAPSTYPEYVTVGFLCYVIGVLHLARTETMRTCDENVLQRSRNVLVEALGAPFLAAAQNYERLSASHRNGDSCSARDVGIHDFSLRNERIYRLKAEGVQLRSFCSIAQYVTVGEVARSALRLATSHDRVRARAVSGRFVTDRVLLATNERFHGDEYTFVSFISSHLASDGSLAMDDAYLLRSFFESMLALPFAALFIGCEEAFVPSTSARPCAAGPTLAQRLRRMQGQW